MRMRTRAVAGIAAVGALAAPALADRDGGNPLSTEADYTPFEAFEPLPTSAQCVSGGNPTQPFVLPAGYRQDIVAVENFLRTAPATCGT